MSPNGPTRPFDPNHKYFVKNNEKVAELENKLKQLEASEYASHLRITEMENYFFRSNIPYSSGSVYGQIYNTYNGGSAITPYSLPPSSPQQQPYGSNGFYEPMFGSHPSSGYPSSSSYGKSHFGVPLSSPPQQSHYSPNHQQQTAYGSPFLSKVTPLSPEYVPKSKTSSKKTSPKNGKSNSPPTDISPPSQDESE